MMHLRDAKLDQKTPPPGSQQVTAIMNMISTIAIDNISAGESDESDQEARPAKRTVEVPNQQSTTLKATYDIIVRAKALGTTNTPAKANGEEN